MNMCRSQQYSEKLVYSQKYQGVEFPESCAIIECLILLSRCEM